MSEEGGTVQERRPRLIAVDLDGTLFSGDLLYENLVACLLTRPVLLIRFLFSGELSIARLKTFLAKAFPVDPAHLPYNQQLLDKLKQEKAAGARLILISAAAELHVERVARELGLFDAYYGTTVGRNLKGNAKVELLGEIGEGHTKIYVGDCMADLVVFSACDESWLVGGDKRLVERVREQANTQGTPFFHLPLARDTWALLRLMRPHHWSKNVLLFLAPVTSFGLYPPERLWELIPTFCAMCLIASSVYFINDLADIQADRAHHRKRRRPLASGTVGVPLALGAVGVMVLVCMGLLFVVPTMVAVGLVTYFLINLAYSAFLKEAVIIDVLILSFLYLLRVLLGAEAVHVDYSLWFVSFIALLFLNLAFLKRYVEVAQRIKSSGEGEKLLRRGYRTDDALVLLVSGLSTVLAGLVVLMLFTLTSTVNSVYSQPSALQLLGLPYLYASLRLWLDSARGEMHHDPVEYVLTSAWFYVVVLVCCIVLVYARYGSQALSWNV